MADPSSTLHVGDSPLEDYVGARNAGFAAVLIDRHDLFIDQPYRRVKSLGEVLDYSTENFADIPTLEYFGYGDGDGHGDGIR